MKKEDSQNIFIYFIASIAALAGVVSDNIGRRCTIIITSLIFLYPRPKERH